MCRAFNYIFNLLEDPAHPSVGPQLKVLNFIGLWRNVNTFSGKLRQLLFYTVVAFFFNQYIKCIINFNIVSLKHILQYVPFHMGIVKSCFFQSYFKNWQNLIDYISSTEVSQLAKGDEKQDKIMKAYISLNRRVTYFFWMMAFLMNFSIFTEPYKRNEINVNGTSVYVYMFDSYSPFPKEPPGYYITMFIQTVLGNIVSAYVVVWDALIVAIMIYFAGQLKIFRLNCSRVIHVSNSIKSHENIAECHRFYTTLVEHQQRFRALISPVMFVYLIVISVSLGVVISQIVETKDDVGALVSAFVFFYGCLVQLLLFYWFSNEVTVESHFTSYGIFESDWTSSTKEIQSELLLLGHTTSKTLVLRAGPFTQMTLTTFLGILRGSYSFYTLLSSTS